MNLWTIFLTGLLTGGLTCMAVQGGLLAATIAQREEERLREKAKKSNNALPIISFLTAKLVAYTMLGFLLGSLGSFFQLSITTRVALQVAVAVFMIGTALNLLNAHPLFRYFIIQPPKFLTRLVRNRSKSRAGDIFAPGMLGAFTVFIPCGTTQAMMALAIVSGNPIIGAAIMSVFVLGTSPLFFLLGYFATRLGESLHQKFMRVAAFAIIFLALFNLNATIALSGSSFTFDNMWSNIWCTVSFCSSQQAAASNFPATAEQTITIATNGYTPETFSVKRGSFVTLRLVNNGGLGCAQAFTIPRLDIQKIIPVGRSDIIQFTAPNETTEIAFMCSMGMYRGTIRVV